MRILMISDHIHFGGGGDALFRIERSGYEKAGYQVFTLSHATNRGASPGPHDYIHVESHSPSVRKALKFSHNYGAERFVREVIDEIRPDAVRLHLISKYPTAVYSALIGQIPVIQTLHGPNLFCATSWGCLSKDSSDCELGVGAKCASRGCVSRVMLPLHLSMHTRLKDLVMKSVSLFHCISRHLTATTRDLGYGPVIYLPPAVGRQFIDAEPATHSGRPTVLYVGVLDQVKGVDVLVEAFQAIARRVPDAELLLAGKGRLEPRLKEMVAAAGLNSQVRFLGFVDNTAIGDLYRQAHVVVMPSIWKEQFGLVGPEALACGVPCVGSNIGGIPEWLKDNEWGYLAEPRDAVGLADRIAALLMDRELRLRFGARGREYVRAAFAPERYQQDMMAMVGQYEAQSVHR
jgi:glycosyltransferase involved in cell wall biosynthesis